MTYSFLFLLVANMLIDVAVRRSRPRRNSRRTARALFAREILLFSFSFLLLNETLDKSKACSIMGIIKQVVDRLGMIIIQALMF